MAEALANADAGSKEAGRVMQDVFGRQGAMQGMKLGRAIATLNTNLEETKKQTGEVGESFDELTKKTDELDKAIMDLLKVDDWDVLKNSIETGIVESMTKCVNLLNDALDVVNNIGKAFGGPVVQGVVDFLVALSGPVGLIYEAYNLLKGGNSNNTTLPKTQEEKAQESATKFIANINTSKDKSGAYSRNIEMLNKTLAKYQKDGNEEKAALTQRVIDIVEEHMDKTFGDYGGTGKKFKPTPTNTKTHVKTDEQLNSEQIQKLTQEYINATDERRKAIEAEIKVLQQRNEEIKKLADIAQGKVAPEGSEDALKEKLKILQTERSKLTDFIEIEIQDQQIKEVQEEIDRLNGKKVEVELEVNNLTLFEKLQDSIKLELSAKNVEVDKNTLKSLTEVVTKYDIQTGTIDISKVMAQTEELTKGGMEAGTAYAKALQDAMVANIDLSTIQQRIGEGINIPDETWQSLLDKINKKLKGLGIEPIEIDFSTGSVKTKQKEKDKEEKKYLSDGLGKLAGGLGGIQSGFQQLGVDLGEGFNDVVSGLQGITSILTGIQAIVSAIQVIAGADALIPLAHGGIVPHAALGRYIGGNSYSGDNIFAGNAWVNSGELVLNRSEQGILSSALQGNAMKDISIRGALRGEDIVLVADRWGRRTGKGELAFWK